MTKIRFDVQYIVTNIRFDVHYRDKDQISGAL